MMKALALFLAVFSLGVVFAAPGPRDSPDFLCQNAGEAKKNTQVLEKYKKRLTQMLEDSNDQTKRKHYSTLVQNCIFLLQPRVDELISLMPGKVK